LLDTLAKQVAIPPGRVYTVTNGAGSVAPVETICLPSERNLMNDTLHTVSDGRLLRLTLNRPQKRNALNLELCRALVATLEAADRDPKLGAILLNANGKSFCAGMDLHEIAVPEIDHDDGALGMVHEQLFTIGGRLSKPLIAAVHGAALAGGTGLVANCHIAIASEDATFGLTEIRLGLWPFLVFRAVAAAVGERRTIELSLTGRILGAAEAHEFGLVHQVVSGDAASLEAQALEVASAIAESSPTAVQSGLRSVQAARGKDWKQAGEIAQRVRREVFGSPDFQEGIRAFGEKRQPRWPSIHDPPAREGG
jgi:enoyl-CoA hydratase/carnithine racemase